MPSPDPSNRAEAPLRACGVELTFPGGVRALQGVDLAVHEDDFLVVLGASGAGKSTLLRSLNRLNTPTAGSILFEGRDVTRVAGGQLRQLRQRVGMVFQQFNLVGRLSVLENVLAGRLSHAGSPMNWVLTHARQFRGADRRIAFECLAQVGIEKQAFQRADTLSGGQQQRVAIARLLAQEPDIILADEPIASLDPASSEVVLRTLREIHETRRIPVVLNLHQVELARQYGKRIIGMRDGRIELDGTPDQLSEDRLQSLYARSADQSRPPSDKKEGVASGEPGADAA